MLFVFILLLPSVAAQGGGGAVLNVAPVIEVFESRAQIVEVGGQEVLEGSVFDGNGPKDVELLRITLEKAPLGTGTFSSEADLQDLGPQRPVEADDDGWEVWVMGDWLMFEFHWEYPRDSVGVFTWRLDAGDGEFTASKSLDVHVRAGDIVGLHVTSGNQDIFADSDTQITYEAKAVDEEGNEVPIDSATDVDWRIAPRGGGFEGNVLTPTSRTGEYLVNARLKDDPSVQASSVLLRVLPAPVAEVRVAPNTIHVAFPHDYTFQASAFDTKGNLLTEARFRWTHDNPEVGALHPETGRLQVRSAGWTNVTATHVASGLNQTALLQAVADVEAVVRLEFGLDDPGAPLEVSAGTRLPSQLVALGPNGEPMGGLPIHWRVENQTIGRIDENGVFRAFKAGSTTITASLVGTDLEASMNVTVVPGPLAQIRVDPPAAAVSTDKTLQLTATAMDGFGNVIDDVGFRWHTDNTTLGTVNQFTGLFHAGSVPQSEVRVTVSSFGVERDAVVYVIAPRVASAQEQTVQEAARVSTSMGGVRTDTHVVGFSEVVEDAQIQIEMGSNGPDSDLRSANLRMGDAGTNVTIIVETQPGTLMVVPDAIDLNDLFDILLGFEIDQPGLYVTVLATENGAVVSSNRLTQLIRDMEVSVRVEADYFHEHGLDPNRAELYKYREGQRVGGALELVLEEPEPEDGFFFFTAHLDRFSSFALVAPAVSTGSGRVGGGGGGSVGGGNTEPGGPGTGGCGEFTFRPALWDVDPVVRGMEAVYDKRVCVPPFPLIHEVRHPLDPFGGAPELQDGVETWRYLELDSLRDPLPEQVVVSLALSAEDAQDARKGLLFGDRGQGWELEDVFPLSGDPGFGRGATVSLHCCGRYAFAADREPPVIDLASVPLLWTGIFDLKPQATDNIGVDRLEVYVDGKRLVEGDVPGTFVIDAAGLPEGPLQVRIVAYDLVGNRAQESLRVLVSSFAVDGFGAQITDNWVLLLGTIILVTIWVAQRRSRRWPLGRRGQSGGPGRPST